MSDRLEELITKRDLLNLTIEGILAERAARAPHRDIGIDGMTAAVWRGMSDDDRRDWTNYWHGRGHGSFVCGACGLPLAFGWSRCGVCDPPPEAGKGERAAKAGGIS